MKTYLIVLISALVVSSATTVSVLGQAEPTGTIPHALQRNWFRKKMMIWYIRVGERALLDFGVGVRVWWCCARWPCELSYLPTSMPSWHDKLLAISFNWWNMSYAVRRCNVCHQQMHCILDRNFASHARTHLQLCSANLPIPSEWHWFILASIPPSCREACRSKGQGCRA